MQTCSIDFSTNLFSNISDSEKGPGSWLEHRVRIINHIRMCIYDFYNKYDEVLHNKFMRCSKYETGVLYKADATKKLWNAIV